MNLAVQTQRSSEQTSRDIIGIFFLKKHVFSLTFLGVIIGALILSFLTPPIYEVSSQLVVKPNYSKPLIFDQDSSRLNVYNSVDEQTLNTVIFLLTSTEVMREVVIKHKMADPEDEKAVLKEIEALRGKIKAEPLTMSSIIKVSYRGGSPQAITDELNSILDAYIRQHIRVNQSTEGRLEFFDDQTKQYQDRFTRLNQELAERSKDMDVIKPDIQKEENLKLINSLELTKSQLNTDIEGFRSKYNNFNSALNRFLSEDRLVGLPSETLLNYPALVEMEKSLAQLLINRQRAQSDYQPTSKQFQDAEAQYRNMKNQIRRSLEQIIRDLQVTIDSHKRAIIDIDKQVKEVQERNRVLTGNALELERLELEHRLTKDNYALYSGKTEEARINVEKDRARFANVSISSRPVLPTSPWFPQRGKIMMLALALALILAIAVSAFSYAMEQKIWTPTDLAIHTQLRYLGSLDAIDHVPRTPVNKPAWRFGFRTH